MEYLPKLYQRHIFREVIFYSHTRAAARTLDPTPQSLTDSAVGYFKRIKASIFFSIENKMQLASRSDFIVYEGIRSVQEVTNLIRFNGENDSWRPAG